MYAPRLIDFLTRTYKGDLLMLTSNRSFNRDYCLLSIQPTTYCLQPTAYWLVIHPRITYKLSDSNHFNLYSLHSCNIVWQLIFDKVIRDSLKCNE